MSVRLSGTDNAKPFTAPCAFAQAFQSVSVSHTGNLYFGVPATPMYLGSRTQALAKCRHMFRRPWLQLVPDSISETTDGRVFVRALGSNMTEMPCGGLMHRN